jgi:hypothetical protein
MSTCRAGSITTRSASAPTAIVPLRGHILNSLAGFVAVAATNRPSDRRAAGYTFGVQLTGADLAQPV